ncbi:MAG TPA: DUF1152 domain-containing protein, partial [Thermoleophilaceae bacterium]|nr:DUF1152 domain-containing protein [Thermoleophilaceae bacterium]
MIDAEALMAAARRPLVIGMGGGGDVVGALATAEVCRLYNGAEPVLGGVTWERRVIDPRPGPRPIEQIEGGEPLAACVVAAGPDTHAEEVVFAESHMARYLGERTVLVDPHPGSAAIADGLAEAADTLGADLIVLLDVGGDALAHGDEPGLASPLCDSLMLAAGARLQSMGRDVLAGVFGVGCDGELTPNEVMERVSEVAAAGGLAGVRGLTERVAERLEGAVKVVPTEASAMAIRCFRGDTGTAEIRRGLRTVPLSPLGALTIYLDPGKTVESAARLAKAVMDAGSMEEANENLNGLGVRT